MCAITGPTGIGKSWCGIALAEDLMEYNGVPFIPKKHVISSLRQVLQLINDREFKHDIENGSPLVFEEPQMEANSRNWQSESNKMLASLISVFREQRLIVFFTCPFLEFIDKQSRILFHAKFEVQSFDKQTELTVVKPRFLEFQPYCPNPDGFYKRRLINHYAIEGKRKYGVEKVGYIHVKAASKPIIDDYMAIKAENSKRYYATLLKQCEDMEKKKVKKDPQADYQKIKELYEKYGENYNILIANLPHISPRTIERHLVYVKKSLKTPTTALVQTDSLTHSSNKQQVDEKDALETNSL